MGTRALDFSHFMDNENFHDGYALPEDSMLPVSSEELAISVHTLCQNVRRDYTMLTVIAEGLPNVIEKMDSVSFETYTEITEALDTLEEQVDFIKESFEDIHDHFIANLRKLADDYTCIMMKNIREAIGNLHRKIHMDRPELLISLNEKLTTEGREKNRAQKSFFKPGDDAKAFVQGILNGTNASRTSVD